MICNTINDCLNEINLYFNREGSGHPFIVNIDDKNLFKTVFSQLQADTQKTIVRVSDFCNNDNFPDTMSALAEASAVGNFVFVGISQYFMLQGKDALSSAISDVISLKAMGHTVVLLNGCNGILKNRQAIDTRLTKDIAILDENTIDLPHIIIAKSDDKYYGTDACNGINELLFKLENSAYNSEITVKTHFSAALFKNSMYPVSVTSGIYGILTQKFNEIKMSTEAEWGTEEQWSDLYDKMNKYKTFSYVIESTLGSTANLPSYIGDKLEETGSLEAWYIWLALKVFSAKGNEYLSLVIRKSLSPAHFVELIYMELLSHSTSESQFSTLYKERKRIIAKLPDDNSVLTQRYCDHIGQYEKKAAYYLTDLTDKEKWEFLRCLNIYDYTDEEVYNITAETFPELNCYLQRFEFTEYNTKIPSSDTVLRSQLTDYFTEYKIQKVTNSIHEGFLEKVNEFAISRPFNKLSPRISIVNDIDKKNSQIHFFDALGVEFLSYIVARCEKLGLQTEIHIASCELPSITKNNLEFKKFFKTVVDENGNDVLPGTKDLDELKHHSKKVDYRKVKEPIHLFMELSIIDRELREIRKILLDDNEFDKIIIVSDHGASRLSVIKEDENNMFTIDDGYSEHSGRCCKTDTNPDIPEIAYENGYAVIANYDRFKGGRSANVEVHGGATLEETVVPIIEVVIKPEKAEIYIVHPYIEFHNKEMVSVTVFSDVALTVPSVFIKELNKSYECISAVDGKHYKFEIPDIKRSGTFVIDLYDGDKLIEGGMEFQAKKAIGTTRDFF